jgi:amino acid transporter
LLLTIGALFSTSGTTSAAIFVGPRTLYAMARAGQLPEFVGRLHAEYQTPGTAIVLYAVVTWAFAALGGFTLLAAVAALARVFYYTTTCLAVPVLRRKMPGSRFRLPGGMLIPVCAIAVCLWLFAGSTREQALAAGGAFVVGAALYGGWQIGRRMF